jgi:hypothetical protein
MNILIVREDNVSCSGTWILSHSVGSMIIMFVLYDDAVFKPTGGWEPSHQFNTSRHIEVKNTSFLRVVFKCRSLPPMFTLGL